MTTVGELVAVLRADSAQFVASMEQAQAQVGALKAETSGFSKAASTAFIAAGAVAVIAIAKMVDATVAWAREVKSVQNVTGQTAESASALLVVAHDFGLGMTQAQVAFTIFSKNVATGNKNIEKFGLVTHDASGAVLPFDQLLSNAADTYVGLTKSTDRAAFAQLLFGRSGRTLIPILKQGAAGLEELKKEAEKSNLVIGQDTVDAAINLGIAERKLGEAFKGVAVTIGTQFLPIATKVINFFVDLVEWTGRISPVIPAFALGLTAVAGAGALLIRVGQGIVGAFTSLFGATSAEVAASTAATESSVSLTEAIVALTAALQTEAGAAAEASAANTALAGAETEATAAAATATGAIGGGGGLVAAIASVGAVAIPVIAIVGLLAAAVIVRSNSMKQAAKAMAESINTATKLLGGPLPASLRAVNAPLGNGTTKLILFGLAFQAAQRNAEIAGKGLDEVAQSTRGSLIAALSAGQISAKQFTQAMKYIGFSGKDAAEVLHHLHDGAALANDTLSEIMQSADPAASSIADVGGAVDLLNAGLANAAPMFQKFADVSGQATDTILGNLSKVVNDASSTPQQVADAYMGALDQMRQANQAWHDSIVQTFGGAGSAMDQFADKHIVDIDKAIGSLQDYTKQIHNFDGDIKAIHKRFGKDASDFIQWASEQGLSQAALVHTVATSSKKDADSFIAQWKRSKDATDQLARDMQAALAPMFNKILQWLKKVVHAIEGVPDPKISNQSVLEALKEIGYAADAAKQKIDAMNGAATPHGGNSPHPHPGGSSSDGLGHYLGGEIRRYAAGGGVDTVPAMLQPGEYVLRKAAVDRIGRHVLDAMNNASGVHSSLSSGDLWKRQAEDAAASIVALTNRSGSTPKEGMGIVRRVSQAGSNAAYIKSVAAGVGRELNAAQAHHFMRALQLLDKRTMDSGARSDAAIQAALGKMSHLLETPPRPDPRWMEQAFKHVSYLPAGHTNISTNHHNRGRGGGTRVILDRRHFDEQTSYQEDYGRGF